MISPDSPTATVPRMSPPDVGPNPAGMDAAIKAILGGQPQPNAIVNPFEDDQALLKLFKEGYRTSFDGRWVYERNWWRNLLYALGRQWIFFNIQRGAWQDKRMQKWIPRPVTNKIAETTDAMRAVFQSVDLTLKCRPLSDDPSDTQTAFIAENLAPALHEEHDMDFRLFEADFWSILTGNAFLHPWFDTRAEHGMLLVPFEKCLACQQTFTPDKIKAAGDRCPNCGQQQFEQAMDASGQPVGNEYPIGRGTTDVCSPFEIGFPGGYTSFDDVPFIIRQRWRTKEWYETNHPELAKRLRFDKMTSERSLQMLKAIASQSDISGTALGAQVSDTTISEGITEFEYWRKPTPAYPRGLLMRIAGNAGSETIIRDDTFQPNELPMKTAQGQPIFPWLHYGYSRFGGRIWARSPIDLIIQKQDQINQLDSLILLGVQRMSNPIWIEPKGAEVKKFTGEPGLVVRYNPLVGNGAKPERIEGSNIPPSLLKLRELYLMDLESLAGTQDVLKGQKPRGVSAFSAMQLLVERAQSRFGPVLGERGKVYRGWFGLALEIERQFGPQERQWAAMGSNRRWAFELFKNAELQGAIRVLIEDGSQAPKTNLGKRAAIEQLNNLQMLNPGDPDQRMEIYRTFGQTALMPALDVAVQSALAEQSEFEAWAQSPASMPMPVPPAPIQPGVQPSRAYFADDAAGAPPAGAAPSGPPPPAVASPMAVELWDDHLVHISEHKKWASGDMMRALFRQRQDLKTEFTMHLMQHQQELLMEQASGTVLPMGALPGQKQPPSQPSPPSAPPGSGIRPAGGAGAGRALRNSNQESGKPGTNDAKPL